MDSSYLLTVLRMLVCLLTLLGTNKLIKVGSDSHKLWLITIIENFSRKLHWIKIKKNLYLNHWQEDKTYIVLGYISGEHKISRKSLLCDDNYSNGTYLSELFPVDCVGNNIDYIDDLAESYQGTWFLTHKTTVEFCKHFEIS